MRLKKGTKVIINPRSVFYNKAGQLPVGKIGNIIMDYGTDEFPYSVSWDRGEFSNNNYNHEDLIVVDFSHYLEKL